MLIAIGQNYLKWGLPDGGGMRAVQGLQGVAQRLVDDLLPLARDRVVIFPPPEERYANIRFRGTGNHAVVRFTPELVRTVANLANMARDQGLDFVAFGLGTDHQFWRVRWAHDPDHPVLGKTCLCISRTHTWIRYEGKDFLFDEKEILETESMPLEKMSPVELLGKTEVQPTSVRASTHQQRYASRLQELLKAQQAYDIAERASLDGDMALDQDILTRLLSLWWSEEELNALKKIQNGLNDITSRMETWYDAIERETESLCLEIMGIRLGDSVTLAEDNRNTRIRVDGANMITDEEDKEVLFLLHGSRYRKDGLPGKREDTIAFRVPWKSST
ncbi:MAG: hypothetical protein WD750_00005 [Gammaproteobacteria bacterium]